MEELVQLPEDEIKFNFFGLSYISQINILDIYLKEIEDTNRAEFDNVFEKYRNIINKFIEFKSHFYKYDDSDKDKLRGIISKCRNKINPNNHIKYGDFDCFINCDDTLYASLYYPKEIDNDFVNKYIYDSFSYSRERRKQIVLELLDYYSQISNLNFDQLFMLCNGNKDMFNREIKLLSNDFYSLYLLMDTSSRMKYIWYLSYYNLFNKCDEAIKQANRKNIECFSDDNRFINPFKESSLNTCGNIKVLSKYFKMN